MERPLPAHLEKLIHELYVPPTLYIFPLVSGSQFVQDGYRDGENIRNDMEKVFLSALEGKNQFHNNVPFVSIEGSFSQRTNKAHSILDENSAYKALV